jgi:hypothetical protein
MQGRTSFARGLITGFGRDEAHRQRQNLVGVDKLVAVEQT